MVRQETIAIEALFQRKVKQAEVQRRMYGYHTHWHLMTRSAQSNHINKARLKVLQSREDILDKLVHEARSKLKLVSSEEAKYHSLLENLLLQVICKV